MSVLNCNDFCWKRFTGASLETPFSLSTCTYSTEFSTVNPGVLKKLDEIMKKSEYIYYQTQLENMEADRRQMLIDMELHYENDTEDEFSAWWYAGGRFEQYRQLTQDIESLRWRLESAEVEEEETVHILYH